jgi:hypothetical protein
MNIFKHDGENSRKLVATEDPNHTLRGFYHRDEDADITITIAQQFGPEADGKGTLMVLDAYEWPGAKPVASVARPWKRGQDYGRAWTELRREVLVRSGVDIGEPIYPKAQGVPPT